METRVPRPVRHIYEVARVCPLFGSSCEPARTHRSRAPPRWEQRSGSDGNPKTGFLSSNEERTELHCAEIYSEYKSRSSAHKCMLHSAACEGVNEEYCRHQEKSGGGYDLHR